MFTNTVTNNGSGGVFALATFLGMRGDTVSYNQGFGVTARLHSTGYVVGSIIENNAWSGIFLEQGSKLSLVQPQTSVLGNPLWGLDCVGWETSVDGTSFLTGTVNPACTGF